MLGCISEKKSGCISDPHADPICGMVKRWYTGYGHPSQLILVIVIGNPMKIEKMD